MLTLVKSIELSTSNYVKLYARCMPHFGVVDYSIEYNLFNYTKSITLDKLTKATALYHFELLTSELQ